MTEYNNVFYIDVIFIINLFLNYIILFDTGKVVNEKIRKLKIVLAAVVGALYSLIIFFPELHLFYTILIKLLVSILMIIVAFTPYKTKKFISLYLWFLMISSIYGAVSLMIFFIFFGVNGIHMLYLQNFPAIILILSVIISHGLITYINNFLRGRLIKDSIYVDIAVGFDGKSKQIKALVDTGNSLTDPLTKDPAIIICYNSIKDILPLEIIQIYAENVEKDLGMVTKILENTEWSYKLRLLPFSTIAKENGMLLGFKPDYVSIDYNNKHCVLHNVIVCLTKHQLNKNNQYEALLSPIIFKQKEVVF